MKHRKTTLHEFLDGSFKRFRELPAESMDSACDRVLNRLQQETDRAPERSFVQSSSPRRYIRLFVIAAATTLTVVFAQQLATRWTRPIPPAEHEVSPPAVSPETVVPLPQSAVEPPKSQPPGRVRFAASSIKVMSPGTMMSSAGLACHGTDGVKRIVLIVTREAQDAVTAPQGRCVGQGLFLSTLIELAYGVKPRQILGGAEWTQTSGSILEFGRGGNFVGLPAQWNGTQVGWFKDESFQVEAIADNPGTATLEQLQQMLQAMIEDRFKLKFHREQREMPGYSLVVAERGHKLKPISGDYQESLVTGNGRSTMDKFARTLASFLLDEVPVVDKTGLEGAYEYQFSLFSPPASRGGAGPAGGGDGTSRGGGNPATGVRAENLSARLEELLGLRLQPEKSVLVDALVIESVAPPSPN